VPEKLKPKIKTNASAVHCRWLEGDESDLFIMVNLTNVPAMAKVETEWDKELYSHAVNWSTGEETKIKKLSQEFTVSSNEMLTLEFIKK